MVYCNARVTRQRKHNLLGSVVNCARIVVCVGASGCVGFNRQFRESALKMTNESDQISARISPRATIIKHTGV